MSTLLAGAVGIGLPTRIAVATAGTAFASTVIGSGVAGPERAGTSAALST